jgi:hypothetical protein
MSGRIAAPIQNVVVVDVCAPGSLKSTLAREAGNEGPAPMTEGTPGNVPIACSLEAGAFQERLAWIAGLNRDGLRDWRRQGRALELHYDSTVRDRVRELVRREAECCAFLTIEVDESDGLVRVSIAVPASAAESAEILLAPFLPTVRGADSS